MGQLTINGKTYQGNDIQIINGNIYIDGVLQSQNQNNLEIHIHGNVQNLECDQNITIHGNVENANAKGSINCNDAQSVYANGSVNCDNVHGNVNAGGSVNCDNVGGSISAGGSVRYG